MPTSTPSSASRLRRDDSYPGDSSRVDAVPDLSAVLFLQAYETLSPWPTSTTPYGWRVRQRVTNEVALLRFVPRAAHAKTHGEGGASIPLAQNTADIEARLASRLTTLQALEAQPTLPRILQSGVSDEGYFILQEAVEGRTLRAVLAESGPMPLESALAICKQIASTLDFVAIQGVSHGCLSPDTVLLGSDDRVFLLDFGLDVLPTSLSLPYLAPEQVGGQPGDSSTDIYQLGALLYTCLSARPPFTGTNRDEIFRRILSTSPAPLLEQPAYVRAILTRCLRRVSDLRYRVAMDMILDLTYQRAPSTLELDPNSSSAQEDCQLGKYMSALALRDEEPVYAVVRQATDKKKKSSFLAIWKQRLGARFQKPKPGESEQGRLPLDSDRGGASDALGASYKPGVDGPPIEGLLGRFKRRMALQEYVFLQPDDPSKRGVRRLLARLGWRRAGLNAPDAPYRKRRVWISPRVMRKLESLWRVTRAAVLLGLVGLVLHAGILVNQNRFATITHLTGRVAKTEENRTRPTFEGAVLDGMNQPLLVTDAKGGAALNLVGARITLDANTVLQVRQLTFHEGRRQAFTLKKGRVWVETAERHGDLAQFEIRGGGTVRAEAARFDVSVSPDGLHVGTLTGNVSVTWQGVKRRLGAERSLNLQEDEKPGKTVALSVGERQQIADHTEAPATTRLATWQHSYEALQETRFMPLVDKVFLLCNYKPGAKGLLEETKSITAARFALDAIGRTLSATGELPATLNLETLQESGLGKDETKRLLAGFVDHKLLLYRPLPNNGYVLFARSADGNKTLLKATTQGVTSVPDSEEERELADAQKPTN